MSLLVKKSAIRVARKVIPEKLRLLPLVAGGGWQHYEKVKKS